MQSPATRALRPDNVCMKIRQAFGGHQCGRPNSTNASMPFGNLMQIKLSVPIPQPPVFTQLALSARYLHCIFKFEMFICLAPSSYLDPRIPCRGQQCFVLYTFVPPWAIFFPTSFYRRRRPIFFYLFYRRRRNFFWHLFPAAPTWIRP